jgi:hypothetical protein
MSVSINGSAGLTFNDGSTQNTSPFAGGFGFRNRIINPDMRIDQRNAGAALSAMSNATYMVDRWGYYATQSGKFNAQQNAGSVTPPAGFKNYLGLTVASAVSVGASDRFGIFQAIEGHNMADFGWGTANASAVTISFPVYSSITGTHSGSVTNYAVTRSYPFTFSVPVANTWTTVSVTIPGDTGGTWVGASNAGALYLNMNLGAGSSLSGTAGAWASAGYWGATGAVSVVGTAGATFYITGVQLEKGSTATSFDYRPYGTELQLCQRYLPAFNLANGDALCMAAVNSSANFFAVVPFLVETRVPPTGVFANNGTYLTAYGSASHVSTSIAFGSASENSARLNVGTSGATAGQAVFLQANNNLVLYFNGCEL